MSAHLRGCRFRCSGYAKQREERAKRKAEEKRAAEKKKWEDSVLGKVPAGKQPKVRVCCVQLAHASVAATGGLTADV